MKKILALLVVFTCVGTMLIPGQEASAAAKINSWDLVDSSKHMDYSGNSKYMSFVKNGANTWNAYKKGVIRPASATNKSDVYCSDVSVTNNINATTYSNGKITFNKKNMDKINNAGKQNVATHELGHGLRLAHNTSVDIMYSYGTSRTTLSTNDKKSYDAAYKKY
ncbi:matrixin family metalloprotease [Listeria welshimeri]|nr:matrixin family metalloprotease [Listeria welshimeri]MBC1390190.1 matrixin family metalloprotease [Listeria welshimeri]MBC2307172.1 matrixin family metalloprotease [Listeria welshimeri]